MRHATVRLLPLLAVSGAVLVATPARAQFDLSGGWLVSLTSSSTTFTVTQTGSDLTATAAGLTWEGTIDASTGAFAIQSTFASAAATLTCAAIEATLTPDGDHFSGTAEFAPLICMGLPPLRPTVCACGIFTSEPVFGARCTGSCPVCGNGLLEAGEQCDDGNTAAGDCCSPSCIAEPAHSLCTSDGNVCTDDRCDGAGACTHQPNSSACGSACLPATCSAGACVPQDPAPPGAPCASDGIACTYDGCDGAGHCAHGPFPNCRGAGRASIALRDDPIGGRVRWNWKDDTGLTALADFGLPTGTTAYHLCLFSGASLLFAGHAPPANGCGDDACWRARSDGFLYHSRGSTPGGLGTLKLRTSGNRSLLVAKGAGAPVDFAASLDVPALRAQLVASDAGQRCWEAAFDHPTVHTATQFRAHE